MNDIPEAVTTVIRIIVSSPATATLSIVGLILLTLAGILAYLAMNKPPEQVTKVLGISLFLSLIGGMIFSAAGPSLALFWVTTVPLKAAATDQLLNNLERNSTARWMIRLIPFDPKTDAELAVGEVERLGKPKQMYSFVGDYEELIGRTAKEALEMTGGTLRPREHISAIIFPLLTQLYPANSRGLLQVIQDVEASREIEIPFLRGSNFLNEEELENLKSTRQASYRVENFKKNYRRYCELAQKFQATPTYSAREYIGGLNPDWHPLGFSSRNANENTCQGSTCCEFPDWKTAKSKMQNSFGSRAFLIRNLEISNIPGRILIDFDQPGSQFIPDIGLRQIPNTPQF